MLRRSKRVSNLGQPKVFRPFHMLPPEAVFEIAGNLTLDEANQLRLGNKMLRDNVLPTNSMMRTQEMFKEELDDRLIEINNIEVNAMSFREGSLNNRLVKGELEMARKQANAMKGAYKTIPLKSPLIDHLPDNPFRKNR